MEKFVASDGTQLTLTDDGRLIMENEYGVYPVTVAAGSGVRALREFFLAEQHGDRRSVMEAFASGTGFLADFAREFLAAHPLPRPWEDAQHGEVWVIRVGEGNEFAARVIRGTADFPRFVSLDDEISYGPRAGIASGRRIWPEVSA